MKNYNIVKTEEIVDELHRRLPHIDKTKIKLVHALLQRELKIAVMQGKTVNIGGLFKFSITKGYVKNFWCVFNKELRQTVMPSHLQLNTVIGFVHTKIKKLLSKGKSIENVETRGLRVDQKYAYKSASRAAAKANEGQKLG